MGHKTIVVIDNDHLDLMKDSPTQFVGKLIEAILKSHGGGQSVFVRGNYGSANVATVVHQCHTNQSPTLKFVDFSAEKI